MDMPSEKHLLVHRLTDVRQVTINLRMISCVTRDRQDMCDKRDDIEIDLVFS